MREDSTVHRQSCNRSGLRYPSMDKSVERRGENADPICTLFPFRCGFIHAKYFASLYILTYVGYSEFARILRRIRVVHRFIYHVRPEGVAARSHAPEAHLSQTFRFSSYTAENTRKAHVTKRAQARVRSACKGVRGARALRASVSADRATPLRVVRPRRRRTR